MQDSLHVVPTHSQGYNNKSNEPEIKFASYTEYIWSVSAFTLLLYRVFLGDKLKFFLPFEEGCSQTDTDKIYSCCLWKLILKVQLIDS